ncbi:MAG: hypothetical protein WD379_04150 [Dehalococcoidia bacterium]
MSMLTEAQYEEYIGLLKAWVDAEKAGGPDESATRDAYAAVRSFRERYGLSQGAAGVEAEGAPVRAEWRRGEAGA